MPFRTVLVSLACSFIVSAASAQKGRNPILPGWYADPEVAQVGKRTFIFPTYSDKYEKQVFLDAFSSRNLRSWKKHSRILDTAAVKWARMAIWAPAYVQKEGKSYIFFSANDVHEGEVGGIGVAVADWPEGPYRDLLGKPLLGTIHNGAQPIDQYVFQDSDSTWYMIYGGWGHCNLVRLKPDFTGLLPHPDGTIYKEITPKGYVEGPIIFRHLGRYYFMWSEGGWGGPDYRVAYAISDSPAGPWERIGTVLQQDPAVATSAGHHSVLRDGDDWHIIYHRRPLGDTHRDHRVVCIDRMEFDAQGRILPVKISFEGVSRK